MNGSVESLGIPDFHRTGGPFGPDNLLDPHFSWGDRGTTTNQNWGIQSRGPYGSVPVPWCGVVPASPAYVPRSPEMGVRLRAASMMITFEVGVWPTCIVPLPAATPSAIRGLIGGMMTGMV